MLFCYVFSLVSKYVCLQICRQNFALANKNMLFIHEPTHYADHETITLRSKYNPAPINTSKSRTYQIVQTMFSTDYTRKNIVGTEGSLAK